MHPVVEANYSMALMLLLKYPIPPSPNGPKTFVEDAVYLRDNFTGIGGDKIVVKYGGRSILSSSSSASASRTSSPFGKRPSAQQKLSKTRSSLPSPARFLQQQGRVEALFQGAAKGVFERGEKLGINQAVRDAVDEVKKNMQGVRSPRPSPNMRRSSDALRWSLDEGRVAPTRGKTVASMELRNRELGRMLDEAMSGLRATTDKGDSSDNDHYTKAIDTAIARMQFVKVYLEDTSMPLPKEISKEASESPVVASSPSETIITPNLLDSGTKNTTERLSEQSDCAVEALQEAASTEALATPTVTAPDVEQESLVDPTKAERPKAPVPTRSTLAQSSFSWMLEPDEPSASGLKSTSTETSSSFLRSGGKRPGSGTSREKSAFLFGDDPDDFDLKGKRNSVQHDEGFDLGTMKGSKGH